MEIRLVFLILITGESRLVLGLTCLQCDNVPQPRHCRTVGECFRGEVCGVEKFTNSFGEELFNVGCLEKSKCTSSSSIDDCIECCQTDLCNAKGCGENGYPLSRGPICYSCPVHTDLKPCHTIQFCGVGEVCLSEAHMEFGDVVYSSSCTNTHVCKSDVFGGPNIVGRDLDGVFEDIAKRTEFRHVCRHCCQEDTCNRQCNSSNTETSTSLCQRLNPCQHGKCYDIPGDYVCVCNNGYDGQQCNISTSLCQKLNPCQNGKCYDIPGDYVCVCDDGFNGKQCNISNNHCLSNPCQNGTCYDIPGDFVCACAFGYEGKQCSESINYCLSNPCQNGTCYGIPGDYVCVCDRGFTGRQCSKSTLSASDCYDILHMNISKTSGVYFVTLWKSKRVIEVFCHMEIEKGGGWTVFQRRFNGSVDFYRNFSEYENGFGSPSGEHWLGLSSIQEMTATRLSELRIDLTAADGNQSYELFQNFRLGIAPSYTLHVDHGTGTAGDSAGLSYSSNNDFATFDRDRNGCAIKDHGGWWYLSCVHANLNGEYGTPGNISSYNNGEGGFIYRDFQSVRMLRESVMMFRRV